MTEYRIVAHRKSDGHREKIMPKGRSFSKAAEDLEKLQEQISIGRLAPYWNDWDLFIEAREVSEWTAISEPS